MTDDKELVVLARRGEESAVRALFDRYGKSVYSFVFSRVQRRVELTEEITQDVFLDAFKNLSEFDENRKFWSWLCGIAQRKIARHLRSALAMKRAAPRESDMVMRQEIARCLERDIPLPESRLLKEDISNAVARALTSLTPQAQDILLMKYIDDLSLEEIGSRLKKSPEAVSSALQRARLNFRKRFGEPDTDETR